MKFTLNLASRSYVNRRALYLFYGICGALLVVMLIFNVVYYVQLRGDISTHELKLRELESQLTRDDTDTRGYSAEAYQQMLVKIGLANDILARDSFRWTGLLDQLEKVVPRKVSIRQIEPDYKNGSIQLNGLAQDLASLKRFIDNLIRSDNYGEVLLLSQSLDRNESGMLQFSLKVEDAF